MNTLPQKAPHMMVHFMGLLLIGLLLLVGNTLPLAADGPAQTAEPLQVATKPFGPFVVKMEDGSFSGFSIELWNELAHRLGLPYELYEVVSVTDQITAVQTGEADAAVAGISITAVREEMIDFSFPYFDAGLQIMVQPSSSFGLRDVIANMLSPSLLQLFGIVVALTIVIAHVVWFIERRSSTSEFPKEYLAGIGEALWWAAITVVGYDDRPPRNRWARLLAILWMFVAIFLIANLTATITAALTVERLYSNINGIADLQDKRVATVAGSTAADYLARYGINAHTVTAIEDAYALLQEDRIDAIVYDAPILLYYATHDGFGDVQMAGNVFEEENYGIALPTDSPHRESINRMLLAMQEDGSYQEIYQRWFAFSE